MNADSPLDCGSGCRGFDPRHSPLNPSETPGADRPLVAPGVTESTGYSSDSVHGAVRKVGPWRRIGGYIGRDVWLENGRRTTELQHRVVAAAKVGRPLSADEHAHHGNEVKTDNRPDNLEVLTKAEHARRYFGRGRTMVTLICQGCGSSFDRDVRRRHSKYCGRVCSARSGGLASGRARVRELLTIEGQRVGGVL